MYRQMGRGRGYSDHSDSGYRQSRGSPSDTFSSSNPKNIPNNATSRLEGEMANLSGRITSFESRQIQCEEKLKEQKKEHAEQRQVDKLEFEKKVATLTWTLERTQLLVEAATDHYPPDIGITFQKHLDDAQGCVAEGFSQIFPRLFPSKDFMNEVDTAANTLRWDKFLDKLKQHYWSHVSPDSEEKEIYQLSSAFTPCRRGHLLAISSTAPLEPAEESLVPTPDAKHFERTFVDGFDRNTMRPVGVSENQFLARQLRFFIPIFIWAFNEMKKILLVEHERIVSILKMIYRQLHYIEKVKGNSHSEYNLPPEESYSERFAAGTCAGFRKGLRWREIVGVAKGEVLPESDAKAKGVRVAVGQPTADVKGTTTATSNVGVASVGKEAEAPSNTTIKEGTKSSVGESSNPSAATFSNASARRKREDDVSDFEEDSRPTHKPWTGSDPPGTSSLDEVPEQSTSRLPTPTEPVPFTLETEPEMAALAIKNAMYVLTGDARTLEMATKLRNFHLHRYNSIRKCLAILLDNNLVNFVVVGPQVARKFSDDKKARKNSKLGINVDVNAALARIQGVVDETFDISTHDEAEIDAQQVSTKLAKLFDGSDDYFDRKEVSVEEAVDEHLDGELKALEGYSTGGLAKTDLYILLRWLEAAFPSA